MGKVRFNGVKALVVDDEPMNLAVARSIFGRYGMKVSSADSGQRSIEMCRENKYDIVFMDHMMPGMDGVEAMKIIRSETIKSKGELPIVALTANAVSTAKEMFISEGFDGFVSKPIELAEFERVMKKVLPESMITYDTAPPKPRQKPEPEAPSAEDAAKESSEISGEPADIFAAAGIDTEAGMRYCMNDEDFYKSLLLQFANESGAKRASLEKALADGNIKDYEVFVHGLKSTSKMVGCTALSEEAKKLELAAVEGRTDYIGEHHGEVMRRYERVIKAVMTVYGQTDAADGGEDILEFTPDTEKNDSVIEFDPEDGHEG